MSNNYHPFWIRNHLERLNPKESNITFHKHFFKRKHRNIPEEICLETIQEGKVVIIRSLWPRKLVFKKYFGKEHITYTIVTFFRRDRIEVRTAWKTEGR